MKKYIYTKAFTLIELMIVVAIIGLLAAIAVPKFADLVNKARDASTKGQLGAVRSALSIYYAANEGIYPTNTNGNTIPGILTGQTYLNEIPIAYRSQNVFTGNDHIVRATFLVNDDFAFSPSYEENYSWMYDPFSFSSGWGIFRVSCTHQDSKGIYWTTY